MIVAFTKDWDDVPTCTTHILREMAGTIPVIWVESIGTRAPRLGSGRDLRRSLRRLRGLFVPPARKENLLWVLSPLLIPGARSNMLMRVNRLLARAQIRRALRVAAAAVPGGDVGLEYWCFVPNAVDLLPTGGQATVVYYCVDDWSQFEGLDGRWLSQKETELLKQADIVFAVSRFLEAKCKAQVGRRVFYMPHGVAYSLFSQGIAESTAVADDMMGLSRPVVGFFGNICRWIDLELIKFLAGRCPSWSFVLIGPVLRDVSSFQDVPNVHFLGRREHDDLPGYCKGFDVGIIPYDMKQGRMASVNPVKTKELLAAGVPVVASRIPEMEVWNSPDVRICDTPEEWLQALEAQAGRRDRAAISERAKGEDWAAKVAGMRRVVEERYELSIR